MPTALNLSQNLKYQLTVISAINFCHSVFLQLLLQGRQEINRPCQWHKRLYTQTFHVLENSNSYITIFHRHTYVHICGYINVCRLLGSLGMLKINLLSVWFFLLRQEHLGVS